MPAPAAVVTLRRVDEASAQQQAQQQQAQQQQEQQQQASGEGPSASGRAQPGSAPAARDRPPGYVVKPAARKGGAAAAAAGAMEVECSGAAEEEEGEEEGIDEGSEWETASEEEMAEGDQVESGWGGVAPWPPPPAPAAASLWRAPPTCRCPGDAAPPSFSRPGKSGICGAACLTITCLTALRTTLRERPPPPTHPPTHTHTHTPHTHTLCLISNFACISSHCSPYACAARQLAPPQKSIRAATCSAHLASTSPTPTA